LDEEKTLQGLVDLGREQGYLTLDQVNGFLPEVSSSTDLRSALQSFEDLHIKILDDVPAFGQRFLSAPALVLARSDSLRSQLPFLAEVGKEHDGAIARVVHGNHFDVGGVRRLCTFPLTNWPYPGESGLLEAGQKIR
jgi:Sigma-70 factor, region 1.1